jgi:hypothetical protein
MKLNALIKRFQATFISLMDALSNGALDLTWHQKTFENKSYPHIKLDVSVRHECPRLEY